MKSNSPWRPNDAKVAAAIAGSGMFRGNSMYRAGLDPNWRPPTGDTQPLIKVGRGELTCLICGETYGAATPVTGEPTQCWRCAGKVGVPTISYLNEGEYE